MEKGPARESRSFCFYVMMIQITILGLLSLEL